MKKLILLLPILLVLLLASCDNTSGPRFEGDVYTIAGLLFSGKTVDLENPVYVTRSSTIEEFNALEIFVADATVTVKDLTAQTEFSLQPTLDEFKVKYTDPANTIIMADHTYRIEVQVPGYDKLIWAETTVPPIAVPVSDLYGTHPAGTGYSLDPETENRIPFTEIDSQYPIVLRTSEVTGESKAYNFFSEVYCLEEFSTALEFTVAVFGITNPDPSLEEAYNNGSIGFRRINMLGRFTSDPQPDLEGNYLLMSDYSFSFALFGKYRVKAYIIDDNYYRYSYMSSGYLHGGVVNGTGYFGSASGGVMYTRISKT